MTANVEFAASAFALEAIKHAAYRFTDKLTIEIEPTDTRIACRLRLIEGKRHDDSLDNLVAQFRNEVLDQDLRIQLRRDTAPVRNLILSLAFSKTGLHE
ncbi:MAG TPA: His-Xaa-Ser system protein HxsD [Rhizomicrobium sp.]|nr:His-Xaa-Ser system protein HxsD [Rhizomicrobium sp.]